MGNHAYGSTKTDTEAGAGLRQSSNPSTEHNAQLRSSQSGLTSVSEYNEPSDQRNNQQTMFDPLPTTSDAVATAEKVGRNQADSSEGACSDEKEA